MRGQRLTWLVAACAVPILGCGQPKPTRSPSALRQQFVAALERDDGKAAFALIEPRVQAATSEAEFLVRWRQDRSEHGAIAVDSKHVDPRHVEVARAATAVYPNGQLLHWALVGGRWLVRAGLPKTQHHTTPRQAIVALLQALDRPPWQGARGLFADEFLGSITQDLFSRRDAIRAALHRGDGLETSHDGQRAELRYDGNRAIRLNLTPHGWKISGLD